MIICLWKSWCHFTMIFFTNKKYLFNLRSGAQLPRRYFSPFLLGILHILIIFITHIYIIKCVINMIFIIHTLSNVSSAWSNLRYGGQLALSSYNNFNNNCHRLSSSSSSKTCHNTQTNIFISLSSYYDYCIITWIIIWP